MKSIQPQQQTTVPRKCLCGHIELVTELQSRNNMMASSVILRFMCFLAVAGTVVSVVSAATSSSRTTSSTTATSTSTTTASVCQDKQGNNYNVGEEVPSKDPCQTCRCYPFNGGEVLCFIVACTPCAGNIIPVEGSCCGECIEGTPCGWNGETYGPGPVGDKCSGYVCDDGEVKYRPPVCDETEISCVDPAFDDNCCPYCPSGTTCKVGKKIIKAGENKNVRKKTCFCQTDPWNPNAVCAVNNGKNLKIKYRQNI